MREAVITRTTKETDIQLQWNLDGEGHSEIDTGIGFFNHMLTLFAFHSNTDLSVRAKGDLDVDDHHTVEDVGIALGQAFAKAIGDKKGINRYGGFTLPMDETLASVHVDISGRPTLVFNAAFQRETVGTFSTEMVEEFFKAFAMNAGVTLHINLHYGTNDHHKIEAIFKAFGRALKESVQITSDKVVSTKGMLA